MSFLDLVDDSFDCQGNQMISLLSDMNIELLSIDRRIAHCWAKVTMIGNLHDKPDTNMS